MEAVRPDELAAEMPLELQGRAAWIEAKRGNYASAIPPMQALVSHGLQRYSCHPGAVERRSFAR
jgi:hypothetical protein